MICLLIWPAITHFVKWCVLQYVDLLCSFFIFRNCAPLTTLSQTNLDAPRFIYLCLLYYIIHIVKNILCDCSHNKQVFHYAYKANYYYQLAYLACCRDNIFNLSDWFDWNSLFPTFPVHIYHTTSSSILFIKNSTAEDGNVSLTRGSGIVAEHT